MKHKTAELEGALLDLAVAKAEGIEADIITIGTISPRQVCQALRPDGELSIWGDYMPSTSWHEGGPIIEREGIELVLHGHGWSANLRWLDQDDMCTQHDSTGATPLIAAMRAYVSSKLGEEVEL